MPKYNFKCEFCGATYEELVELNTKNYKCTCGKEAIKVPSLSNLHLKGAGWFKVDYSKEDQ